MADDTILFGDSVPESYARYLEPVIFRPWAERLVDVVGLAAGQTVLDVAAGTGVVSRLAAERVGSSGRVIASDLSSDMLEQLATDYSGEAPLQTVRCSATDLRLPDRSVDVAFCQQGFPFIPDRTAAAREMRRVLHPGGKVGIAVWLSSPRVEPFIVYGEALQAQGVPEPFPNAYNSLKTSMSAEDVDDALRDAGFVDIDVRVAHLELDWPSPERAAQAVAGTPYGPVVAALDADTRQQVMADLLRRMTGSNGAAVRHTMTSVLARGTS